MRFFSRPRGSRRTTVPAKVENEPSHRTSPARSRGASSWQISSVRIVFQKNAKTAKTAKNKPDLSLRPLRPLRSSARTIGAFSLALPANPSIVSLKQRRVNRQPDEVNDDLVRARPRQCFRELGRLIADDDDLGLVDEVVDGVAEQRRKMWNLFLDVFLVRADQFREKHILVVDAELASLAEQLLGEDDDRALAQVVGARLEAETEQADLLLARFHDLVERLLDLQLVARQNLRDDRQLDVHFLRAVLQRADILWEARAAECEARLQVVGREVQLLVATEDVHHFVAVDTDALAQVADLVREADFQRVPRVVRVFHHLGDADAGADERRVDRLVEGNGPARVGCVVVADEGERGLAEILERRAFAEELGIHRHAEAVAVLLAGLALERRDHLLVRRPRQHGAADDDDVVVRFVFQRGANLL